MRKTFSEKRCDFIMGTVQCMGFIFNTNAYYRTTYAFVVKPASGLENIKSVFDLSSGVGKEKIGRACRCPCRSRRKQGGSDAVTRTSHRFIVDTRHENPRRRRWRTTWLRCASTALFMRGLPAGGYRELTAVVKLVVVPLLEEVPHAEKFYLLHHHGYVGWRDDGSIRSTTSLLIVSPTSGRYSSSRRHGVLPIGVVMPMLPSLVLRKSGTNFLERTRPACCSHPIRASVEACCARARRA